MSHAHWPPLAALRQDALDYTYRNRMRASTAQSVRSMDSSLKGRKTFNLRAHGKRRVLHVYAVLGLSSKVARFSQCACLRSIPRRCRYPSSFLAVFWLWLVLTYLPRSEERLACRDVVTRGQSLFRASTSAERAGWLHDWRAQVDDQTASRAQSC